MDLKLLIGLVAVVFGADVFFTLFQRRKRDEVLNRLSEHLARKEFDAFDALIDDPKTRKLVPAFNVQFMKLNKEMMKEDGKAVDEAFKAFRMNMNAAQKEAVYKRGFYYYLSLEDEEETRTYYDLLKELKPSDMQMLDVMYDTYILKGSRYADLMIGEAEKASEENRIPIYALLADMYHNAGDEEKASEYEKIVTDYTEKLKAEKKG
jgi:hypothetical protein